MARLDSGWESLIPPLPLLQRKGPRALILLGILAVSSLLVWISLPRDGADLGYSAHPLGDENDVHVADGQLDTAIAPALDHDQPGTQPDADEGEQANPAGLVEVDPTTSGASETPSASPLPADSSPATQPAEDETADHGGQSDGEHVEEEGVEEHSDASPEHLPGEDPEQHPKGQEASPNSPRDRRFVLIVPATSPSPDLCKTIITAMALGYPSPIIINWGVDYRDVTGWDGGKNLPKIPGFVDYLDSVLHPEAHPSERLEEDDLVLMVDAYDMWFQLPAEVLLRRYHAINDEANARLRTEWPGQGPMPMKQTIIAASGKNCHPSSLSWGSDLHCEVLPDSPLSPDLYGPETEKDMKKHHDHRPKYINGGLYIGPAGDMRRMFRRTLEKMQKGLGEGVHLASEQGIPGEVLGEQEVWRRWRRSTEMMADGDDNDALGLIGRDFEYHFGLDYRQQLSVQTVWTETADGLFDGDFVTLNNHTDIEQHSKALGISTPRLGGVPDDIREASNPLGGTLGAPDWGDMALYADFFTSAVPAILHHNGYKERRVSWWHRPWFHKQLRQLLSVRLTSREPTTAFATVETGDGSISYRAVPAEEADKWPRSSRGSAREPLRRMQFGDICRDPEKMPDSPGAHWWDEVFRDDQGPLTVPLA